MSTEEKNKRIGLVVSLTIHTALLILCFFMLAWQAPNPPHPEYGVELNFGMDAAGSGDIQTKSPAGETENIEKPAPGDAAPKSTPTPQPEETEPVEEEVVEEEPTAKTYDVEEAPVYEKPKPVKPTPTPAPKPVTKPDPTPIKAAEYPSTSKEAGAKGTDGASNKAAANNNGDKPGTVGDQGDTRGTVDGKALYGTPGGGGGGANLNMAGWMWSAPPNKPDASNEDGRIVFEIKVDADGEITSVIPLETTVSPAVVRHYKNQVYNLEFNKTAGYKPAPESVGRITIVIKSR